MSALKDSLDFRVNWLPFLLNPDTPPEGYDKKEYIAQKYGSYNPNMFLRLQQAGAKVGIAFKDGGRVVNTIDSHRLIEFAMKHGKQDEAVSELFHRYFELLEDISKQDVLVDIGQSVGLDSQQVRDFLASGEGRTEIRAADVRAKRQRVNGVPHFTFNGGQSFSGAQPPEVFIDVLSDFIP